jgi:hypothetical protein
VTRLPWRTAGIVLVVLAAIVYFYPYVAVPH